MVLGKTPMVLGKTQLFDQLIHWKKDLNWLNKFNVIFLSYRNQSVEFTYRATLKSFRNRNLKAFYKMF